ncbi:MAG: hypothetical protein ACLUG4_05690 [Bacilli bacterium]
MPIIRAEALLRLQRGTLPIKAKENCNSLGKRVWIAIMVKIKKLNDMMIEDKISTFFLFKIK